MRECNSYANFDANSFWFAAAVVVEEHGLVVVRRELTPEDLAALEKEGGGEVEMADASRARVYDIALPAAGAEGSAAVRARWAMGAAAPVAS